MLASAASVDKYKYMQVRINMQICKFHHML
jgi:hypothetical protein